ncbi:6-phosphogluconate dehydrogenase, decarboxylating [Paramicrosporidium saccamoebae]|uniref:6-phosphogluconate dehydrogenase, decarboxylating n=1 Tax=Paramicrosporidium saccamoebae TaxID=1246581 RepID=A0A2H9THH8_9FUNG|nr:6-phosphogluconate dehydrogenase, decarboxylating [Paramicrosporidium saccamoebae]
MVKAGSAVDDFVNQLLPHLTAGDIIIDGGNSLYTDTERRVKTLSAQGVHFVGCGVSGGEEGARYGPSMMPGGSPGAWPHLREMLQAVSAKADGVPCCDWVGEGGAGHFVKMVHNGIEYGDMQLICEAFHLMHDGLGLGYEEMSAVFGEWNKSELESFLIQITSDILKFQQDGHYLVDRIRDAAGQKGTGKWTVEASLDMGIPVTLVSEAVFARSLSALKEERLRASKILVGPKTAGFTKDKTEILEHLKKALYGAKIISYAQGFMLFSEASKTFNWNLNMGAIATMWKGGCIIKSAFLGDIRKAFDRNPNLENLLFDSFFTQALAQAHPSWRLILSESILIGLPVPALSSALAFYDGYRCERLPANLLQAQRDYFGAHTFELLDNPGVYKHVNWTGQGGTTSSTNYQA